MKYNMLIQKKKIHRTPQTHPWGRKLGNLREILTFFNVFWLNHSNATSYEV